MFCSDQGSEIDRQREQYEKLTWKLERKLEELDGELALQRQVRRAACGIWRLIRPGQSAWGGRWRQVTGTQGSAELLAGSRLWQGTQWLPRSSR